MPPVISPTSQDWVGVAGGAGGTVAPGLVPSTNSNSQTVINPAAGTVLSDTTGGGGGTTPVVDPKVGQEAAFNLEDQGALQSAGATGDTAARDYGGSILDYLTGAQQQQNTINNEGVQADLAKRQASQGVLDYVHDGLQSGGVLLGSHNAGSSSATEALARAYSTLGAHQMAGVGTQYAGDENKVNLDQTNLGIANAGQARKDTQYEADTVAGIVSTANATINGIKANMAFYSLPDQINAQAQIAQIQSDTTAKLAAVGQTLQTGAGGVAGLNDINPSSESDRAGAAQNLANAGTAATNPYQLTTQAPAAFQDGSLPAGADLPIFTIPRNKQTA